MQEAVALASPIDQLERGTTFVPDELAFFPDAIVLADAQARVTYLNPAAEQLLGLSMKKACGYALGKVLVLQDRDTRQPVSVFEACSEARLFDGVFPLLASSGGKWVPVQCSVTRTPSGSDKAGPYIVSLRNADDLQQHIDKLMAQTMHDEHTRLLRRAELIKRMWRLLQEPDRGEPHAFMYMDLNNFKSVNDQAGHAAGDHAIRQIASRLKAVVRERDSLARLGGDEFGLLLEHCPPELARERADQLSRAVESHVFSWNNETYRLGVSIGLATFKSRNLSLNTILSAADAACYQAKREARNGVHIKEVALD